MRYNIFVLFAIVSVLYNVYSLPLQRVTYYVDGTRGSDSNPGTAQQPFKTLTKARDTVRGVSKEGGIQVLIRGGDYSLAKETFQLSQQDSGTSSGRITYSGYEKEKVRLTGGQIIPHNAISSLNLEDIKRIPKEGVLAGASVVDLKSLGITNFGNLANGGLGQCVNNKLELFINSKPMVLARYPNIASNGLWMWDSILNVTSPMSFKYSGNRPTTNNWASAPDLWLHGYWAVDWADNYIHVVKVDTSSSTIFLDPKTPPIYNLENKARYYAVNLLEELDVPEEYYLDRGSGKLYFIPPRPLVSTDEVVVSIGENLLSMNGASYVTLKNLYIEFSRTTPVQVQGNNINIVNCTISNNGGISVEMSGSNNVIDSSSSTGNGCGVFSVYGGDQKTLTRGNNRVTNNEISYYARWKRTYQPGISWGGVGNYYGGNNIHHAPHNGILGGGNDCLFENNHLSYLCYEVSDSGAFYTGRSWIERGNVVRSSLFENIYVTEDPRLGSLSVEAIYLDDEMSGYEVYNNTFRNCFVGTFIGGGRRTSVHNNAYYNCSVSVHLDNRGMNWANGDCKPGGMFQQQLESVNYKQPPWSTHYPELVNIMQDHPCVPVYNVIKDNTYCGGNFLNVNQKDLNDWLDTAENNVVKC